MRIALISLLLVCFCVIVVADEKVEKDAIPKAATGFAGMIAGEVVAVGEDAVIVRVTDFKPWKHSKAEKPVSLIGKRVLITIVPEVYTNLKLGDAYLARVRQFFRSLKPGDTESFDVKHSEGDSLRFLELTGAQSKKFPDGKKEEKRIDEAEKEKIEKAEQIEKAAKVENEKTAKQLEDIVLPSIPADFLGFAGMITGKVLQNAEGLCVIEVTKVAQWKHSEAQDANSIIGRKVAIKIVPAVYENKHAGPVYLTTVKRFFRLLNRGDVDSFDVKCTDGQALTFLELTESQKEKVEKATREMIDKLEKK